MQNIVRGARYERKGGVSCRDPTSGRELGIHYAFCLVRNQEVRYVVDINVRSLFDDHYCFENASEPFRATGRATLGYSFDRRADNLWRLFRRRRSPDKNLPESDWKLLSVWWAELHTGFASLHGSKQSLAGIAQMGNRDNPPLVRGTSHHPRRPHTQPLDSVEQVT